jgi:hypothetical protein
MQGNPTGQGRPPSHQSLAALWQEATEIVQEAISEAEAAIDFIGSTLESLQPLLERVRTLEAQIQGAPAALGARPAQPEPGPAPQTPAPEAEVQTERAEAGPEPTPPPERVEAPPPAREAVARYTLTLETGDTRPDFPKLYHRLDEGLGTAEMALISYLGGVAVITVEGPDLVPDALEHAIRASVGADVELEWEDEQHLRVHLI